MLININTDGFSPTMMQKTSQHEYMRMCSVVTVKNYIHRLANPMLEVRCTNKSKNTLVEFVTYTGHTDGPSTLCFEAGICQNNKYAVNGFVSYA